MDEFTYCEETLTLWMNNIDTIDIDEEIADTKATIANEELWLKGSTSVENEQQHLQNIANYKEYIKRLTDLKNT